MSKAYPPREFPDLPSFEESLDRWLAEREARLPRWLRVLLTVMPFFGLCFLASNVVLALTSLAPQPDNGVALQDVVFVAGLLLVGFPFVYLAGVRMSMPPKPTRRRYQKTLDLLRARLRHSSKEKKDS
ncbi:hypothetical protein [Burkholderia ubonensis]|uniref:hypothetical protein n=1 Tax=Burkholderia ubonensis TaxID=101571 RepID=UPI00075AECA4|nr:hypothetical protein [Burkholderia ubonensis]KVP39593.1 hypothetical protein WJ87_04980 [Burkholderia ubonensis]